MSPLAQSVYKTLVFFDALEMPLTALQIQDYLLADKKLPRQVSLSEILSALDGELRGRVVGTGSIYYLPGREEFAKAAIQERYRISLQRLRKAQRFLRGLRHVPYVRAAAISGSLALLNSKPASDIDLFIIVKKNRIWLARVLVSGYFQILGQRRHGRFISDRFCLNHFVTEELAVSRDKDLFTAVSYASMLPAFGAAVVSRFWQKNPWLRDFLHAPVLEETNTFFALPPSRWQRGVEFVSDWTVGPLLNRLFGWYQRRRIRLQDDIIVNDDELSFHFATRGKTVLARFEKGCQALEPS